MSIRTISVALELRINNYVAGLKEAAKSSEGLAKAMETAGEKTENVFDPAKVRQITAEWEKLKDTAQQNSAAWNDVAGGMAKAGAVAIGSVGLAVREYANFDKAMSGVASTGDDARQNLEALREAAIEAGADTAYSATEAAHGVEELAHAGVSARDALGGGLKGSLDLAAAGQIEVADAAGIASIAMTQFKLSGQAIPHVADLLAAGAGKAMGGVGDLGEALGNGGLQASQFGMSIEETVGTLAAFAANGQIGAEAGTQLKSMLLALASPSKEAQRTMDELGISAYDASGQFVGLESLAGQLSAAFAGQSAATRDAAMATIFGSHAIQAANILYKEGAEGIAGWTVAVNDSGYAARTAAELQNNLLGDLEKLGGAWSTLDIQMGSAADGPLRGLVQTVTQLIDLAGKFPGISQSLLGFAGVLGTVALSGAGIMKAVSGYAEFRTSLKALTDANPALGKTADRLGKIGKAAGVATAAIAGIQLLGAAVEELGSHNQNLELTEAAVKRLLNSGVGTASLDSVFRDAGDAAKGLTWNVKDLESAIGDVKSLGGFTEWLDNHGVLNVLRGVTSDSQKLRQAFKDIDTSLTNLSDNEAVRAFQDLNAEFREQNVTAEQIVDLFPDYSAKLQRVAADAGLAELSHEDLVAAMAGQNEAIGEAIRVQAAWSSAVKDYHTQGRGQAAMLEQAAQAFDAWTVSARMGATTSEEGAKAYQEYLNIYANSDAAFVNVLGAWDAVIQKNQEVAQATADATRSSEDSWEDFYDGMSVNVTDYLAALDEQVAAQQAWESNMVTLSGRVSEGVLTHLASLGPEGAPLVAGLVDATDAELQHLETVFGEGGANATNAFAEEVVNAGSVWKALTAVAGKEAVAGAQAEFAAGKKTLQDIVNDYDLKTVMEVQKDRAMADLVVWQAALDDLSEEETTEFWANLDDASAAEVEAALEWLARTRDMDIAVRYYNVNLPPAARDRIDSNIANAQRNAAGGRIVGPGTGTSDDVLMWGSNGEFMIREWAARAIGYDRLEYLNRTGNLPAFADGGRIGASATSGTYSKVTNNSPATTITNNTYNLEGREAMQYVLDHFRDGKRRDYQARGVH